MIYIVLRSKSFIHKDLQAKILPNLKNVKEYYLIKRITQEAVDDLESISLRSGQTPHKVRGTDKFDQNR